LALSEIPTSLRRGGIDIAARLFRWSLNTVVTIWIPYPQNPPIRDFRKTCVRDCRKQSSVFLCVLSGKDFQLAEIGHKRWLKFTKLDLRPILLIQNQRLSRTKIRPWDCNDWKVPGR
jgi:hypothetical protein